MRRLHVVLSGRAAEQLDELREFWPKSTGEVPSQEVLIQRALERYHSGFFGTSTSSRRRGMKPVQESPSLNPQGPAKRFKES